MEVENQHTVLVVDDEPDVAELYAEYLKTDYEVWTATNGTQALDIIDGSVDVVLLDRRMPGMSGDEVLRGIRSRELPCRVAMVTAVSPDFDILEMGFDDYVLKPVSRDDLHLTVEKLIEIGNYEREVQEYYALTAKKVALERELGEEVIRNEGDYEEFEDRLKQLEADLDEQLSEFSPKEFETLFHDMSVDDFKSKMRERINEGR